MFASLINKIKEATKDNNEKQKDELKKGDISETVSDKTERKPPKGEEGLNTPTLNASRSTKNTEAPRVSNNETALFSQENATEKTSSNQIGDGITSTTNVSTTMKSEKSTDRKSFRSADETQIAINTISCADSLTALATSDGKVVDLVGSQPTTLDDSAALSPTQPPPTASVLSAASPSDRYRHRLLDFFSRYDPMKKFTDQQIDALVDAKCGVPEHLFFARLLSSYGLAQPIPSIVVAGPDNTPVATSSSNARSRDSAKKRRTDNSSGHERADVSTPEALEEEGLLSPPSCTTSDQVVSSANDRLNLALLNDEKNKSGGSSVMVEASPTQARAKGIGISAFEGEGSGTTQQLQAGINFRRTLTSQSASKGGGVISRVESVVANNRQKEIEKEVFSTSTHFAVNGGHQRTRSSAGFRGEEVDDDDALTAKDKDQLQSVISPTLDVRASFNNPLIRSRAATPEKPDERIGDGFNTEDEDEKRTLMKVKVVTSSSSSSASVSEASDSTSETPSFSSRRAHEKVTNEKEEKGRARKSRKERAGRTRQSSMHVWQAEWDQIASAFFPSADFEPKTWNSNNNTATSPNTKYIVLGEREDEEFYLVPLEEELEDVATCSVASHHGRGKHSTTAASTPTALSMSATSSRRNNHASYFVASSQQSQQHPSLSPPLALSVRGLSGSGRGAQGLTAISMMKGSAVHGRGAGGGVRGGGGGGGNVVLGEDGRLYRIGASMGRHGQRIIYGGIDMLVDHRNMLVGPDARTMRTLNAQNPYCWSAVHGIVPLTSKGGAAALRTERAEAALEAAPNVVAAAAAKLQGLTRVPSVSGGGIISLQSTLKDGSFTNSAGLQNANGSGAHVEDEGFGFEKDSARQGRGKSRNSCRNALRLERDSYDYDERLASIIERRRDALVDRAEARMRRAGMMAPLLTNQYYNERRAEQEKEDNYTNETETEEVKAPKTAQRRRSFISARASSSCSSGSSSLYSTDDSGNDSFVSSLVSSLSDLAHIDKVELYLVPDRSKYVLPSAASNGRSSNNTNSIGAANTKNSNAESSGDGKRRSSFFGDDHISRLIVEQQEELAGQRALLASLNRPNVEARVLVELAERKEKVQRIQEEAFLASLYDSHFDTCDMDFLEDQKRGVNSLGLFPPRIASASNIDGLVGSTYVEDLLVGMDDSFASGSTACRSLQSPVEILEHVEGEESLGAEPCAKEASHPAVVKESTEGLQKESEDANDRVAIAAAGGESLSFTSDVGVESIATSAGCGDVPQATLNPPALKKEQNNMSFFARLVGPMKDSGKGSSTTTKAASLSSDPQGRAADASYDARIQLESPVRIGDEEIVNSSASAVAAAESLRRLQSSTSVMLPVACDGFSEQDHRQQWVTESDKMTNNAQISCPQVRGAESPKTETAPDAALDLDLYGEETLDPNQV